jgi:tryptophan synthase alpha subunit
VVRLATKARQATEASPGVVLGSVMARMVENAEVL